MTDLSYGAIRDPDYQAHVTSGKKTISADEAYLLVPDENGRIEIPNIVEFTFQNPDWQPHSSVIINPVREEYLYLSAEERQVYAALLGAGKKEQAARFLELLERPLNARRQLAQNENLARYCDEHPIAATMINISSALLMPIELIQILGEAVQLKGSKKPEAKLGMDPNSSAFQFTQANRVVRDTVTADMGTVGKVAYDLVTGAGQGILGFAVGGPAAANVIFSSKNAAQTAHEIAGRGGTPEQVLLGASTGFLVETITNAVPLGQLGKLTDAAGQLEFQGMLGGILKQAGLSFTSTSTASAMERFADDQIMGEKSYVSQMEQELRKQGYTAEEARDRAALWNYIALPAMNGALGAMGSVATSIGLITIAGLRGKYAQTIALDDQLNQIQQNQQDLQDPLAQSQSGDIMKEDKGKSPQTTSWFNNDGSINYPPNDGAVLNTEQTISLKPGTVLGRYGHIGDNSNFVTQAGADPDKLSLPPNTDPAIYQEFIVVKEIPQSVQAEIAAWGNSKGGGLQYKLPMPIKELIRRGYIVPR